MKLVCSRQLNEYLRLRRAGTPTDDAAFMADIGIGEARLHDQAETAGEYSHIATNEMPHPGFRPSTATAEGTADQRDSVNGGGIGAVMFPPMVSPVAPSTQETTDMARAKRKETPISGEVPKPDFDLAVRIYRGDIKPSSSKQAEHAQELSQAYKEIKNTAHIQPQAAKLAFKLDGMEESKRDDFLRSFRGLLTELNIFMPRDLIDVAEGAEKQDVVPTGERPRPQLVTVPKAPADDSDLADENQQAAE